MRTIKIKRCIKQLPNLDESIRHLDGYTIKKRDGLWYILKEDGELLSDIGFWEVIKCSDCFVVNLDGQWQSLSFQGEIQDDFVDVETNIDAPSLALEIKDRSFPPHTILPLQLDEHSTVFINEDGKPVCETGIIEYWKLVTDDTDSRYVVKYGWCKNRLFLIDSSGTEHDAGRGLWVDGPKKWQDTNDCTFIKYYSSGLFLVKSHEKYGFAILGEETSYQIPYQYDEIEEVDELLFRVKVNGLYALLDSTGRELTPVKYARIDIQELKSFSNVIVFDDHLSLRGYSYPDDSKLFMMAVLDKDGKEIVPPIYECISRYRHTQELELPLFVVSSSNQLLKTYSDNDHEIELGSYHGERLYTPSWGLYNPKIGEIVPQEFEQFSIMGESQIILCRHGCYYVLFDLNGDILMGCNADVRLINGYFILSWNPYCHCIIDKDLKLVMNDSSSIQLEKGVFVCKQTSRRKSSFWDDSPECIGGMKDYILPDGALFRNIYQIKNMIEQGFA